MTRNEPTLLVGFAAEARVARLSGWKVGIGGGTTEGAANVVRRLIDSGARGIVSFGLAGGLDPRMPAGTLIVAGAVAVDGSIRPTDSALNARLGGTTGHLCLGWSRPVSCPDEKRRLNRETGASTVDMESGVVASIAAAAGVPFAVVRAVCDPAHRVVPPAALVALTTAGRFAIMRLAASLMTNPRQLGALLELARDAAAGRRALRAHALRMAPNVAWPRGFPPARRLADDLVPDGILSVGNL